MGEYEPDDSRDVTLSASEAPGEPPRTGPREEAARMQAEGTGDRERAPGEPPVDRATLAKDRADAQRAQGPDSPGHTAD